MLPAPSRVLAALFEEREALLSHSVVTVGETLIGLLIAAAAGILLAVLMDACRPFKTAIYPLLVVSQTVPVIVLAPIFIIYLGFGLAPKVLTVVLMCFFPIVVSFADGMEPGRPKPDQPHPGLWGKPSAGIYLCQASGGGAHPVFGAQGGRDLQHFGRRGRRSGWPATRGWDTTCFA